MGRTTRRRAPSRSAHTMTIPQLRQSMNHIMQFAQHLVRMGKGKDQVKQFQSEWQKTFHKPLNAKIAKNYLDHVKRFRGKTMKKRGGAQAVVPAPLGYRMEPGVQLPYGQFPEYVSKGFFVPESDNVSNCGKLDGTEVVPPDMGSNKVGGRRSTRRRLAFKGKKRGGATLTDVMNTAMNAASAIAMRPFTSQSPPTVQHSVMMDMKGVTPNPGGQAYETTYQYRMAPGGLAPLPSAPQLTYNANTVNNTPATA